MFGIFADLLSSVITIFFPVFASYKALRSSDPSQLAPWLMYWVVLSLVLLAESWTVFIIGWFPFYSWIRLFFMAYLVLPQTQGAKILYIDYVAPFLEQHERDIEEMIGRSHERARALGLQYFYQAIDLIRQKVLGLPPQQEAPPPPSGPAAYAQSLLSRFNMPSAGAPTASSGDWFSALSGVMSSVASTGTSREDREANLSQSGTLLQRQLQSMTGQEKTTFISQQREALDFLRRTLAEEEHGTARGDPDTDGLAYGASLRKNTSDNSFDVVDEEDVARATRRTSGWSSWLGTDQDSSSSSGAEYGRATGYDRRG